MRRSLNRQSDKWDILVLSVFDRRDKLANLLSLLVPQIRRFDDVNVVVLSDHIHYEVGYKRTKLLEMSTAEYVSFIDDDDEVPDDFVDIIYPYLDGVNDYVGFQVQYYVDGKPHEKKTYHNAEYDRWFDDGKAWYRHIVHTNPIKREIASQFPLIGQFGEDAQWSKEVKASGLVKNHAYIDQVLYHYKYSQKGSLTRRYA